MRIYRKLPRLHAEVLEQHSCKGQENRYHVTRSPPSSLYLSLDPIAMYEQGLSQSPQQRSQVSVTGAAVLSRP